MEEFRELIKFLLPFKFVLLLAVLCMVLATAMNLAGPQMIRILIDTITLGVEGEASMRNINLLALAVIGIFILRAFAQFGTNYVAHYGAWKILEDIRKHLYNHIQSLSMKFFADEKTGDLMSRMINDTRNFEQLIAHAIPTIIVNGLVFVGVAIILFSMNLQLALYTLIPVPFLAAAVLKFSVISRPLFREAQDRISDVNSLIHDNFAGIKEIKSFTKEEEEKKNAHQKIALHTKKILQALKLSAIFQPLIQFISGTGTVIVIFIGGRLALAGDLPLGDLVAFFLYMNMFYEPITSLGRINEGLQQALGSAERVIEILDMEPEIKNHPEAEHLGNVEGRIEFINVNFRYVKGVPVLRNINFDLEPGESAALVGPTGVGKTTLANLLPRFYEIESGKILVDGKNIKKIKVDSLRKNISLVSQDVFLFNGSVRDNIRYGRPGAEENEITEASLTANAHEFIIKLEKGYDTTVGERGVKLSGGQKQRISIARAILKDAPILILDEATSSVDTRTEQLIQEALEKLMKNKTTIIIAHRLSTIQNADKIFVLKQGEIVEEGQHSELIKQDGLYSQLCKNQIAR